MFGFVVRLSMFVEQCTEIVNKPHFLAIDFGLCDDGDGNIVPQLIELQAFPTLFFYQPYLGKAFLRHYPNIPKEGFHYFFSHLNDTTYLEEVKKIVLGNEKPENVILMELYPEKQKTLRLQDITLYYLLFDLLNSRI